MSEQKNKNISSPNSDSCIQEHENTSSVNNSSENSSGLDKFVSWVNGDISGIDDSPKGISENIRKKKNPDNDNDQKKKLKKLNRWYIPLAVICCCAFIAILLFVVAKNPSFGVPDAPTNNIVAEKYIKDGLSDTGATNIVAGMILDYRAFDTLGESTVLFIAVMSVIILLRRDEEKRTEKERIEFEAEKSELIKETKIEEKYPEIILQTIAKFAVPIIFIFGIYVVLNGQISPGGGFSGGAIIGAGLILYVVAFGERKAKKFFNFKIFTIITSCALLTYAVLKCYSFYTGAHHIESGIPLGTPGAILSGGFILPLNICVGFIVACTMFGFYRLFSKGEI